ncbi:MAG: hypothetical protein ACYTGQ_19885 [Planctomycetota bacterium]
MTATTSPARNAGEVGIGFGTGLDDAAGVVEPMVLEDAPRPSASSEPRVGAL